MSADLVAVELFAGAGGLSLGLEKAGFRVVLANEIEQDFASSFASNHPNTKVLDCDIRKIDFQKEIKQIKVNKVDLVSGGPPCQGFSTVGSKNQLDHRNSLFYEYLRAVYELQPSYVLFENVSGFQKLYGGIAFRTLLQELSCLGYETTTGIIDASDFGLPQIRKRTIIIGWKKTLSPVSLPEPTHGDSFSLFPKLDKLTIQDAISDLPPLESGGTANFYANEPQNSFQKLVRENCNHLTEHNCANYGARMQQILSMIPQGGSVLDLPEWLRPKDYFHNTYARLVSDRPAPTITRNFGTPSSSRCIHPTQNRALSTREGARLQGFPDSYQFIGSKSSKNLQIGNAVPPILAEVVAKQIIISIKKAL
jgi:DNA (cytosine-5)-methyltransferase 1